MAESMQGLHRSHRCTEVSNKNIGETVTVMGWVQKKRNLGSLIFVDLRDRSGLLQLVFDDNDKEVFEKAGKLRNEFVIAAVGTVNKRAGSVNESMETGDIEINVTSLRILSESETPPIPVDDDANTKDELRLKYRYLDLRKPHLQKNLKLRSDVTTFVRKFMANEGFLEIETPILNRSTPEGARDYLVPSRVHPGTFYALPQSPQVLKQLLMCSGCDRYFQVAKCFRDEDLRADRQPEFTQLDMELSFVDVDDILDVNERMLQALWKEVLGVDVTLPLPRMTWQEAMDRYGSDKPDTRFGMELINVTDVVKDCGFGVFSGAVANGGTVRGLNAKGQGEMARKKIDALVEFVKTYGAKGLAYIAMHEDGTIKSSFAKFMTEEEMNNLIAAMGGEPGDLLLFAADKNKVVWDSLGALRLELAKQMDIIPEGKWNFLWITEFPQFEWSDEQGRFLAMHHPFTMPMDDCIQYLDSAPEKVIAKAFDLVLNGTELSSGSIRITDYELQQKMFQSLGLTDEEIEAKFGFLVEAYKYGAPPHGGLGIGLDRLAMVMLQAESLRDVVAFPKVQNASELMSACPSTVDKESLDVLGIAVTAENDD